MTLTPEGGAAIPVSVTTTRKVQGGAAIPVYGYMTAPTDGRPAMGGAAIPVRVLTAADLKENGGQWTLEGRPHAMPVYTAPATTMVQGGPAIAVYPVNAWPTVPVVPAWAPTDFGAALKLWLDHSVISTLFKDKNPPTIPVTANDDYIYEALDRGTGGNHVTCAEAVNRAIYKTNIQNAMAAGYLSGPGGQTAHYDANVTNLGLTQPLTVFMVLQWTATELPGGSPMTVFDALAGNGLQLYHDVLFPVGKIRARAAAAGTASAACAFAPNVTHLVTVKFNGASSILRIDGTQVAAWNCGVGSTTAPLTIGMTNHANLWKGYIMEAHFVEADVAAATILDDEDYLATKWDVYAPKYLSAEVGLVNATTLAMTFSINVSASDYAAGVTIKKGGVSQAISAAVRQTDKRVVYYTIPAVANGATVTWEYAQASGNIVGDDHGVTLKDVAAQTVTNNVFPATSTLINDAFTDTNGVHVHDHVIAPTNGPATAWTEGTGNLTIQTNQADNAAWVLTPAVLDAGVANVTITAKITQWGSTQAGIICRYTDANNYIWCWRNGSSGAMVIVRREGGANTTIGQVAGTADTQVYKVVCIGTTISFSDASGNTVTAITSFNQAATKHGMIIDFGKIDDFTVVG